MVLIPPSLFFFVAKLFISIIKSGNEYLTIKSKWKWVLNITWKITCVENYTPVKVHKSSPVRVTVNCPSYLQTSCITSLLKTVYPQTPNSCRPLNSSPFLNFWKNICSVMLFLIHLCTSHHFNLTVFTLVLHSLFTVVSSDVMCYLITWTEHSIWLCKMWCPSRQSTWSTTFLYVHAASFKIYDTHFVVVLLTTIKYIFLLQPTTLPAL